MGISNARRLGDCMGHRMLLPGVSKIMLGVHHGTFARNTIILGNTHLPV